MDPLQTEEGNIAIIPTDWQRLDDRPRLIVRLKRPGRVPDLFLYHIEEDGNLTPIKDLKYRVNLSKLGTVVAYAVSHPLPEGRYVAHFVEPRFNHITQIGFYCSPNGIRHDMSPDTIEGLLIQVASARLIANGIGKSGTTWLWHLLATLPGCRCVDMDGKGLLGIDHRELSAVAVGEAYHGHLRYGYETVSELERLGFLVFVIVRDLRDVVVSEYFHKFHMSIDPALDHLRHYPMEELLSFQNIMKWSTSLYAAHDMLSWNASGDCVMIRYEDLLDNPSLVIGNALKAASLHVEQSVIDYIVTCNEFERVTGGRPRGVADPVSPLRKGIVGDWCNYLSAETSAEILRRFAAYYQEFYPAVVSAGVEPDLGEDAQAAATR